MRFSMQPYTVERETKACNWCGLRNEARSTLHFAVSMSGEEKNMYWGFTSGLNEDKPLEFFRNGPDYVYFYTIHAKCLVGALDCAIKEAC